MSFSVVLLGSPNSGKTTLYNWLTQSKFRTVNYPGSTTEYAVGECASRWGLKATVVDTPGVYSLLPKSADEQVTCEILKALPLENKSRKLVVVVDGTQIARHLLLARQVQDSGVPFVIAITMKDLLSKQGLELKKEVLEKEFSVPVVMVDGLLGGGITDLIAQLQTIPANEIPLQFKGWTQTQSDIIRRKFETVAEQALGLRHASVTQVLKPIFERTKMLDRWLLHPVFGLLIFLGVMTLLFSSIYWAATPFMNGIDAVFGWLNERALSLGEEKLWVDFLSNAVIAGFGSVLIFVPQIFILFFAIGLLESTGYLARAATMVDRPFSKLGMSGRSFVPLLSGFACAVPAMMATRNISSSRDRWITNFIIPLMTCSARLPVYALLLTFLFVDEPLKAGFALALLYLLALIVGAGVAAILHRILKRNDVSLLMMELPLYRQPRWSVLLHQTLEKTKAFIKRAGPVIFVLSLLIWVLSTFPRTDLAGNERFNQSYLAQTGQVLEPLFSPMGLDWRAGIGILSSFAAREVFVSTMAVIFNIESETEDGLSEGLLASLREARTSGGDLVFTMSSVVGLLLFFAIALQCMSTFAIAIKEGGSWKFAWLQLFVFNSLAYGLAVLAVQMLRMAGLP
ncbi:MAG: ferrous iron transporter B [Pseudobdellovibrionaceae bacterium]